MRVIPTENTHKVFIRSAKWIGLTDTESVIYSVNNLIGGTVVKRKIQILATLSCMLLVLFSIFVFSACSSECEHDWQEKSVTPAGCTQDGQKLFECSKCQETKTEAIAKTGHTGGTATCTNKAICENCDTEYGEKNADNHTGEAEWITTASKHEKKYVCCNVVVVAEEAHEFTNGACSECGYGCAHTGGTATCTEKAICELCGQQYGEKNADNHTGEAEWTRTASKHEKKYECCGVAAVAEENHEWTDGACSECQYICVHTGGTANCKDKAVCTNCGESYGELATNNHTGEAIWTKTATTHSSKYDCCNAVKAAEENHNFNSGVCTECEYVCEHTGGTATCTDKAVCTNCGASYGAVDEDNHTGDIVWVKTDAKHSKIYDCCDAVASAEADHYFENGVCTVCEKACAHAGGEATCTSKAVCELCGISYGELDAANHTGRVVWIKTATNHSSRYKCCDAIVVAVENHEWADGVCEECNKVCAHTGGEATCTSKAVCELCGISYGELDVDNHTEEATWTKTEAKHSSKYNCCSTEAVAEADHNFDNGVCTECGYERQNTIDFEGDVVIGSEYYTGENVANINNELHILNLKDDNSFTLYSCNVGGSGIKYFIERNGTAEYNSETGIYTLIFDNRKKEYGRVKDSIFEFCNEDGSPIETVNEREGDGITEVAITVRKGNTDYGYLDLAKNKNGKAMQTLYRDLLKIYEDFYGSNTDIEEKNGKYVLSTVDLNQYGITADEAISVWKIFGLENPAYYYFYNTVTISGGEMILCVAEEYALASERAKYEADIQAMIEECGALLDNGMSELHKVMAIHDYIIKKINYAYENDGTTPEDASWAHNIIGVSTVGKGVCEAYAKSFQLLCRYYGIEALTLSGFGGELHAWNLAKVEGKWYCFDLTWNDTGDNDKLSYDCFGLCYSNMNASRTHDMPKSFGVDYLYDIPAVSSMDIQLCTLYKNGESLGFCMSIDYAFSLMDDKDAEYEIALYDYSYTGPLLLSNAVIKHYIYSESTPAVKKISLSGSYKQSDNGYVTLTALHCLNPKGLTVNSDFAIENMEFLRICPSFPGIYLNDVSLIFSGATCESEVPFIGKLSEDNTESEIVVDAELVTIYSQVDINRIVCTEEQVEAQASICLRNSTKADFVSVFLQIYCDEGDTVTIGEFETTGVRSQIWVQNCKLVLGDISFREETEELTLRMRFGRLEEVSDIIITGKVDGTVPVIIDIDGQITYQTTDEHGNVLDEWTKIADPLDIEESFLHINENVSFDNLSFAFVERTDHGGYDINMTYMYTVDSEYNVILKDTTETEDGFIISGDTLIKYRGDSSTPTIPPGIRIIGHQAFFNSSVTEIVIPEGVEILGEYIFQLCESLERVSLPSTLTAIGERAIDTTGSVSYNGTRLEWNCLVSKMNFDYPTKSVSCIDGMSMRNGFFYEEYDYTEFYYGSQEFIHTVIYSEYVDGAYEEITGNATSIFLLTKVGEGLYDIGCYTVYGENGEYERSLITVNNLEGVYSDETGIYTLTIDNATYYIRITGDTFVFCSQDGEETTSSHPTFDLYY